MSLRQYFKRHLPGSDIVRDIFRRHVELIFTGGQRRGNHQLAGVDARLLVPMQRDGRGAVKVRADGAGGFRRAYAQRTVSPRR